MPAYVIVDVEVTDPERYEEYKKITPASLIPFGGKFIVRGGQVKILEGDWSPGRIVIIEFPSLEKAQTWWNSDEYTHARDIRKNAASARIIVADGIKVPV